MHRIHAGWIFCAVLSACAQAQPPLPKAPAIADSEPDVSEQVRAALGQAGMGTLAPDQLTDNARAALSAGTVSALRPCGAAPAVELLRRSTKGEVRQYLYRLPCHGTPLLVEIDFGKGARISRLNVRPEP
jgi:hypothetical protein